ncbi:plastocyanin/azurin family copper-binding protein [Gelidibacter gilvus]|uniref:Azurin n=1 Tax=Gelidibacter gilvus TaxID=59602 RepID=A0A4Q0XJ25_9FLAO|nr:plastocyanin/azurin family copper-binding protein [Gelidibacter gilvus]RXJ50198.1 Azurin [Gelidibacter gilvus]
MKKLLFAPVVAVLLILSSCSKKDSDDSPVIHDPITIELKGNDAMQFVGTTDFNVKSGQDINLILTHIGQLPKEAMGHNVVVLKPGTNLDDFATKAFQSRENDYIPATFASSIVAHAKLLGPGESDAIKFKIETPGVHTFICSFPGHYGTMRGTITVK